LSTTVRKSSTDFKSNDFSCIEDCLSKFKTLRTLCEECKINIEEYLCIYLILSKLGSSYSMFVSTFYSMQEALGIAYKKPNLENFCDALIREKDNLVQLGVIGTAGTSNKSLTIHQKDKPNNPKKQHPHHDNKQYKGPKPTQTASAPNGDKGENIKVIRLTDIETSVIKMVMMSPNVSRRWHL
jgi:hypothetical protein